MNEKKLKGVLKHSVFKNSAWMFFGFGGRLLFQFFSFLLLARYLGPSEFGEFASGLSLVTLIAPFVDLGSFNLIIQDVAKGIKTNLAVGNSLFISLFSFPAGIIVLVLLKLFLLPQTSIQLILSLGFSEFLGNRFLHIAFGANCAHSKLWRNAVVEILAGIIRLILVIVLIKSNGILETWGYFYALQTVLCGAAALLFTFYTWGRPQFLIKDVIKRLVPGFHFASGAAAQTAGNDLDKTMIARLENFDSAGIYAAAYRFIQVAYLPLNAFMSAVYPKFFQIGINGFQQAKRFSLKILPLTITYGGIVLIGFLLFGNDLNVLLGGGYEDSGQAIKILAFIPLIQSIFFPFADALSGSGNQLYRTKVQTLGLIVNLGFNILYIPKYGWKAAAYGAVFSQGLILILVLIFPLLRKTSKTDSQVVSDT